MTSIQGYIVVKYDMPTCWSSDQLVESACRGGPVSTFADPETAEFAIRKTVERWPEKERVNAYRVFAIRPLLAAPTYSRPTKVPPL